VPTLDLILAYHKAAPRRLRREP